MRQKTDRNNRLIKFKASHPNWSNVSIGKLFKITDTRVKQIINAYDNKDTVTTVNKTLDSEVV